MSLSPAAYTRLARLLQETAGIVLEEGKEYLVQARLGPVANAEGCASVGELVEGLGQLRPATRQRLVEAMLTGETQFFRDVHPFDCLRQVILPELMEERRAERALNLWCAAASTGQEPYSLAMLLADHFGPTVGWDCRLLASDFSGQALQRAEEALYNQLEVDRGLPPELLERHFAREGANWRLNGPVRRRVTFRTLNLLGPWPRLPPMDLVLLRNVMIYFGDETKKQILEKVRAVLRPGGFLLLGASETLAFPTAGLEQHRWGKTVYYRSVT